MKKTRKAFALVFALVLAVSCMMLSGCIVGVAVSDGPVLIKSAVNAEPVVPEGYTLTGKQNFDEKGNAIWQIQQVRTAAELVICKWIDINGNEVANPDTPLAYPVKTQSVQIDRGDSLPETYDARDYGLVMPVENQIGGTCWTHAVAACAEANYIKKGYGKSVDLSEYHIAWYSTNGYYDGVADSSNDGYRISSAYNILNNGGNADMASEALYNFAGAALESSFRFNSTTDIDLAAEMPSKFTWANKYKHDVVVDTIKSLGTYNVDTIKQAVLDYGAVRISYESVDLYYSTADLFNADPNKPVAFYKGILNIAQPTNHAVTIVGWDDNFSRTNFATLSRPLRNGAWLVKNSWGTSWGNDGYFWLSYEDITAQYFPAHVVDVADASDYEDVYMKDGLGYHMTVSAQAAANVFTAKNNIYLTKISYGSIRKMPYTLKIYTGIPSNCTNPTKGTLIYTQKGTTSADSRYIDLTGTVNISKGQRFSVVMEADTVFFEGNYSESFDGQSYFTSAAGESFVKSGGEWLDASECSYGTDDDYEAMNNSCIRAIAKKQADSAPYKVTFTDPGYYSESVVTNTGTITLPKKSGHTYVLTYDGKTFNSTTVSRDMTVEMHCYPTQGKPVSSSGCSAEYKCIYCGKEMKPTVTDHDYKTETTKATKTSIGHTKKTCNLCGKVAKNEYVYYEGSVHGEGNYTNGSQRWQYIDGILTVDITGKIPDYSSAGAVPWISYTSQITKLYVTGTPTYLSKYHFSGLNKLTSVNLYSGIKEIGAYCFSGAASLKAFACPSSLTKLGDYCFNGAKSLTDITYNSKLTTWGESVFNGCSAMTQATIPGTLTTIGAFPFRDCSALKKITVSEGVTYMPCLIWGNSVLEEIVIPSTVKNGEFYNYSHLNKYTVSADNSYYTSVDGVLFNKNKTTLVSYPATKADVYYKIPETVNTIKILAFNLTEGLEYLDMSACGVTEIDTNTFNQTWTIENVNLPSKLTSIKSKGFERTKIISIYVPSTVTSIASDAFYLDTEGKKYYNIPNFFTNSSSAKIKSFADSNSYVCLVHTSHDYDTTLAQIGENLCTEGGTAIRGCFCGEFECSQFGAIGHNYEWKTTREPTCIEPGLKQFSCTRCGEVSIIGTAVIPAIGYHDYSAKTVKTEALKSAKTCTAAAVYYYSCSMCGKVEKNSNHTFTNGSAAGHSYQYTTSPKATFTTNGTKKGVCTSCGETKSQTVYAAKSVSLSQERYIYSGTNKTPKLTIKDSKGNKLVKNTDYTLAVASSRKTIGRYTVKITLKGDYEGKKSVYFYILPGKPSSVKSASQTTTSVTLKWSAVSGAAGYTVYRYSPSKGDYVKSGSTTGTSFTVGSLYAGTKYTFRVKAYGKTTAGKIYYSDEYTTIKTATKTKTPTLSKVTSPTAGQARLYWSSVSGETGYTVYYSTYSNLGFKKYKNYSANSTGGYATELTRGKTYYFKVRCYIKTDSGYVYSDWSSVKSVKIK